MLSEAMPTGWEFDQAWLDRCFGRSCKVLSVLALGWEFFRCGGRPDSQF
jgi:hypothetical protein